MKKSGGFLLGLAVFAGFFLLAMAMFAGFAAVSAFLYPIIAGLAGLSVILFVFGVLPMSFFKRYRTFLAAASIMLSYVCGIAVWLFSFLTIVFYLGWFALFFLFVFRAVSVIACLGLAFKGRWDVAIGILVGLAVTYGMRFYGMWLASIDARTVREEYDVEIIDDAPSTEKTGGGSKICPACHKENDPSRSTCWNCDAFLWKSLS